MLYFYLHINMFIFSFVTTLIEKYILNKHCDEKHILYHIITSVPLKSGRIKN